MLIHRYSRNDFETRCAARIEFELEKGHPKDHCCVIAVPGGSTPRKIWDVLLKNRKDWNEIKLIMTDERMVISESKESNFGQLQRKFQSFGLSFNSPMSDYQTDRGYFDQTSNTLEEIITENGSLDLIWLGFGEDGHFASLFPNGRPISQNRYQVLVKHPTSNQMRSSLPMNIITGSTILMTFTGINKLVQFEKVVKEKSWPLLELLKSQEFTVVIGNEL